MTNLEKIYFVLIIVFGKNSVIFDLNFYQNLHKTCNFAKNKFKLSLHLHPYLHMV
jgi:hypothetical protein